LAEVREANEKKRLIALREAMSHDDIARIIADTKELKRLQETPDAPETLATIPSLKREDLERSNKNIPLTTLTEQDTTILYHDLFTNGIVYLDIGFNLHELPQRYIPYIPLFSRALIEMGTEREDYVKISQRIGRTTGGIHPSILTSMIIDQKEAAARLFLRGKAVVSKIPDLIEILEDILLIPQLDNQERFKQMVLEEKARQEQSIVPSGHHIVNLRLQSHFSESGWVAEQMDGVTYLFFLRKLITMVDHAWPSVRSTLQEMLHILINKKSMITNVTTDEKGWGETLPCIASFLGKMPVKDRSPATWLPESPYEYEGMTIPAQVNYVGKGMNLFRWGYRFTGSTAVITRYLRTSWLWDHVRVQGGAYGAFCHFDHLSGVLTFLSYRDPNLTKTLEIFDKTSDFLENVSLDEKEMTKCITGAIGDIDTYLLPSAKGYTSMIRYLTGVSDAYRQQIRDDVLATGIDDFRSLAQALKQAREDGLIKVLGSKSAIHNAVTDERLPLQVFDVL
jgi:Zn-dependent M16 (insulinase) family peptidase